MQGQVSTHCLGKVRCLGAPYSDGSPRLEIHIPISESYCLPFRFGVRVPIRIAIGEIEYLGGLRSTSSNLYTWICPDIYYPDGKRVTLGQMLTSAGFQANDQVELVSNGTSIAVHLRSSTANPVASVKKSVSAKKEFTVTRVRIPVARVRQGELVLYATSLKVKDLVSEGFCNVETLDPTDPNDSGYQRLLNHGRAKKLADYIVKGQDSEDAFLPTSVFLATDKSIDFNHEDHTIEIDTSLSGPFSVVDGQHRLEGLKMAAEKDSRVLDFEVPVNIAINLPKIAQMCHFLIVNTTQKGVDKSVEQRIIARLSEALDVEDLPSLPRWILRTVEKGEVDKAIKYVDFLNETEGSPWFGKIQIANIESDEATINQRTFVKAIVKYVLTANNPLAIVNDFEKEKKIFLNYWKAIALHLDHGDSGTLYKYGSVELFCKFSIPFFTKLQDRGSFTVSTMTEVLKSCFENVEGEYAGVGHPEWWTTGGQAGRLKSGALNLVAQAMSKALHRGSMSDSIEL